jgi:DNA-binding transcriptional MerR regulator
MIRGFSRQEVLSLTSLNSNKLSYLDRTDLVKPQKVGNPKRPKVFYSWEQLLQLKVIERLRERLSLQEIRKVLDFLKGRDYEPSLFTCRLVFVGPQLYLIEDWEDFGQVVLKVSGVNKGQIVIHEIGVIGNLMAELSNRAERNHVTDFLKRTEGTPLALV